MLFSSHSRQYGFLFYTVLTLLLPCLVATHASAAKWQFGSGISSEVSQVRTRNSDVSEANSKDTIWRVAPHISFSGKGKALNVNAQLGVERAEFSESGDTNTQPDASLNAEITLVDRIAWMDIDASVSRQRHTFNQTAEDFLGDLETENTQFDFVLTERTDLSLASNTRLGAAYRFSQSKISGDDDQSSHTHAVDIDTVSYLRTKGFYITSELNYQKTDIEDTGVVTTGLLTGGVGIPIGGASTVSLKLGREWNDIPEVQNNLDGQFWQIGVRWQPSTRVLLEVAYGERVFGKNPLLRAQFTSRRNTTTIQWTRVSAVQRGLLLINDFSVNNLSNDELDDQVSETEQNALDEFQSASPYDAQAVDEELRLSHVIRGRVSSVNGAIGFNKRTQLGGDTATDTKLMFISLDFTRTVGKSLNVIAGMRAAKSEDTGVSGKERSSGIRLGLSWQF